MSSGILTTHQLVARYVYLCTWGTPFARILGHDKGGLVVIAADRTCRHARVRDAA